MAGERCPYEVLGVGRDATRTQIRTAYRALAKQLHPDRPHGSAEDFVALARAYELLSHPERRARHDRAPEREDTEPEARVGYPPAPDLSGVAATSDDLDRRWQAVVASYDLRPARRRRWWSRRGA